MHVRYEPDPVFKPVSSAQPKLDCSEVGLDGDQELWLLQLPLDFPAGASVSWTISEDPEDGVRGHCTIKGAEYVLVPEPEALSAALFATPASEHGSLVPVTRRMTVARVSAAPLVCFGQDGRELGKAGMAPQVAQLLSPDKKALEKKKAEQRRRGPAAVAPTIPKPRGGAAPAVPNKKGQATPGSEGPREAEAAAPGGAPAAAAEQQQQQQPGEKGKQKKDKSEKKKKKKREQEEGAAAAALEAAGGSEPSGKKQRKAAEQQAVAPVAAAPALAAAAATPSEAPAAPAAAGKPEKKKKEKKDKKDKKKKSST
ncbi:expressed protein [Chlorella variabilis]|uniref:Expressed protein n=1 Tax=Chlorella variabilis TaxID=554065 RepID=E1ZR31_CHLVA|nr:expressed protein [Chlorella variabilis]EFN51659.1 expressed protein [Chlorella variabilis]|eukprot:XP_005843761.1 expressed protein [Chlorella variabilis]